MPHGYSRDAWVAAVDETRRLLSQRVNSSNPLISYSELAARISSIRIQPDDPRFATLLDEVSRAESDAGRGMLSVIVVHKEGDQRPGAGFFRLARKLGHSSVDKDQVWLAELNKVKASWSMGVSDSVGRARSTIQVGRSIETLPFLVPEYPFPSHPISRGVPKFYRLQELSDKVEGRTRRTEFFERTIVGMFLRLGRAVPYAFYSSNGEIRSLDAGCIKFLLNRSSPEIEVTCNSEGAVVSITPLSSLIDRYSRDDQTFAQFASDDEDVELPFDTYGLGDERKYAVSRNVQREGANAFRSGVLWAWKRRCAITGTSVECTLDAAHIYPYNGSSTNVLSNGIALRSDLHALFDNHLISLRYVGRNLILEIASELRGTEYDAYSGKSLTLPEAKSSRPHLKVVEYHYEKFLDRRVKSRSEVIRITPGAD